MSETMAGADDAQVERSNNSEAADVETIYVVHGAPPTMAVEMITGASSGWMLALGAMTNEAAIEMARDYKPGSGVQVEQPPMDGDKLEALVSDVSGLKSDVQRLKSSSIPEQVDLLAGEIDGLKVKADRMGSRVDALESARVSPVVPAAPVSEQPANLSPPIPASVDPAGEHPAA